MELSFNKFILFAIFFINLKISHGFEEKLSSKNFQKEFLKEISDVMKASAVDHLNKFIKQIQIPENTEESFRKELDLALNSKRLETKITLIKQWLDMSHNRDTTKENMYALRNVKFLKKLKTRFYELQEESFEEIHQLKYYFLCKQFETNQTDTRGKNKPYPYTKLMPILDENIASALERLGLKDNHTITVDVQQFGITLYGKVKEQGSEIINDYLIIIKKLLQEVVETDTEDSSKQQHSEILNKILVEIDGLLNTKDFYAKRQRLYDYLQNHLALDYEQFQNSDHAQQDLVDIFEKLKQKGLDLIVAYLFSNFEFLEYLHEQWALQLPEAPAALFDEKQGQQLKRIQQLYGEFKKDFENSSKYDSYLEAVKLLHESTLQDKTDSTHIYELLHSASQNVGSVRANMMKTKCNEI